MDNIKRFEAAAGFLPPGLRDIFMSLGDDIKNDIREIRLRSRRPVVAVTSEGSFFIAGKWFFVRNAEFVFFQSCRNKGVFWDRHSG